MIKIERYLNKNNFEWDNFIDSSKNGVFFFKRNYMDYHSSRFIDHSLIFKDSDKIVAVLPSTENSNKLISHGGLTFGGIISDFKMTTPLMLNIFENLSKYSNDNNLESCIYKAIPHIYHTFPAEEDLYALYRIGARLIKREVTTSIKNTNRINYQTRRIRSIDKAKKLGVIIKEAEKELEWEEYWELLSSVLLTRHKVAPVHTFAEINYLRKLFPENIKLFFSICNNRINSGVVLFIHKNNSHTQYLCSNDEGQKNGCLDYVIDSVLHSNSMKTEFFDFGVSTGDEGKLLNEGLINQKEGFGGRSIIHDSYEIKFK